jgi:hypothetical protein
MHASIKITNGVQQLNRTRIGLISVLPIQIERMPEKSGVLSLTCIPASTEILSIIKTSFKFIKLFYTKAWWENNRFISRACLRTV